eukprot:Clim_evm8s60 gene=Clim_evmTU8s60
MQKYGLAAGIVVLGLVELPAEAESTAQLDLAAVPVFEPYVQAAETSGNKDGKPSVNEPAEEQLTGAVAANLGPFTDEPTEQPTDNPTEEPTDEPTTEPTDEPTGQPTPTERPTDEPTKQPTHKPTKQPTHEPTKQPTHEPTKQPTHEPTEPTKDPVKEPTDRSTETTTVTETPTPGPVHKPDFPVNPKAQLAIYTSVIGVMGLLMAFVGYRLYRVVLFFLGFVLVSILTFRLFFDHLQLSLLVIYILSTVLGLLTGWLVSYFWNYTMIIYGLVWGLSISTVVLATPLNDFITKDALTYAIYAVSAALFVLLVLFAQRASLIASTSFIGSLSLVSAADFFAKTGFNRSILATLAKALRTHNLLGIHVGWESIGWHQDVSIGAAMGMLMAYLILAMIAIMIQAFVTAKNYNHRAAEITRYVPDEERPLLAPQTPTHYSASMQASPSTRAAPTQTQVNGMNGSASPKKKRGWFRSN